MEKIQLVTVDYYSLVKELARNATIDEISNNPDFYDILDDENDDAMYEEDGSFIPEIQEVNLRWIEYFDDIIKSNQMPIPEPVEKLFIKINTIDGEHVATLSVNEHLNLEAIEKIKKAFNEHNNCTVTDISDFQISNALNGNVAAIQIKYQLDEIDYEDEDAPEPEQTTLYLSQTWLY